MTNYPSVSKIYSVLLVEKPTTSLQRLSYADIKTGVKAKSAGRCCARGVTAFFYYRKTELIELGLASGILRV
jgi:hypothetical protein